jgi:MOSC domain-containing protein YiiM
MSPTVTTTPFLASLLCIVVTLGYLLFRPTSTKTKTKPLSLRNGTVLSLSKSPKHEFSKDLVDSVTLIAGLGIEGDSHLGVEVQHLYRRTGKPPYPPNLRQVHLIHSELFEEFRSEGEDGTRYDVKPGDLGENITTQGLDVLGLGEGTRLHFLNETEEIEDLDEQKETHAVVRITGLRNPCWQISKFKAGLQERCLVRDEERKIVERKAGIMAIVEVGGVIRKGARIIVEAPEVFKALCQV